MYYLVCFHSLLLLLLCCLSEILLLGFLVFHVTTTASCCVHRHLPSVRGDIGLENAPEYVIICWEELDRRFWLSVLMDVQYLLYRVCLLFGLVYMIFAKECPISPGVCEVGFCKPWLSFLGLVHHSVATPALLYQRTLWTADCLCLEVLTNIYCVSVLYSCTN